MKFDITTKNVEVNEHLKRITEQKLGKLDKYFGETEPTAKVSYKKQSRDCTLEIMLSYAGKLVRASVSGENFYDNLDLILPKLEGQIRKHRTKFDQHNKNNAFKDASLYKANVEEDKNLTVVKEKKFKLERMTVNEAIEEMELLGHSFYVFLDAKTATVQVLYKRNDGDLGLIEPEV